MPSDDQNDAADLDRFRATLKQAGADGLPRRPWQHPRQPASDTDLVWFAAWSARDVETTDQAVLRAGLRLLAAARAELDQVESGLLFAARDAEMTWPEIAEALGLGSAQAAQQRLSRVLARTSGPGTEP
ncbi:sigma-70 family RNA polymerase sigma factor [Arthrobacter cheniae]|uniref:Sigma-70 family RNA polymerase sigma factor n=1 Tax=Arthrobacter cheniae TaxID=1258888 RepID=A0A3A5M9J3_9MICC|nr:sigma-70 family RNA polymerase sigma factor [Arthrobacter cheniae]